MLDLTLGAELGSRYRVARPTAAFAAATSAALPPLRIGMALRAPGGIAPAGEIGAAVESAAAALRRAGHTVGDFEFPQSANIGEAAAIIWMSATAEIGRAHV